MPTQNQPSAANRVRQVQGEAIRLQVISRTLAGDSPSKIAKDLHRAVRTIDRLIREARAEGYLEPASFWQYYAREAAARSIDAHRLITRVLEVIATDDMLQAILDDDKETN